MDVHHHILVSAMIAAILFPFTGWFSLLALVGGVLVDVDHYIWFITNKKDFSLVHAYKFMKHEYTGDSYMTLVFHNIEFWVICITCAIFWPLYWPFVFGLKAHMIMDLYMFFKYRKTHPQPVAYSLVKKYFVDKI
jgi:hypothetical protein